ncbi:Uncharacterised protein [Vibrio cholerae]|nr:Uncharacterised protein [Vibrio cholerae]
MLSERINSISLGRVVFADKCSSLTPVANAISATFCALIPAPAMIEMRPALCLTSCAKRSIPR